MDAMDSSAFPLSFVVHVGERGPRSGRLDALSETDLRHLEAARGWMMLGRWLEPNEELENITWLIRAHAAVKL